MSQRGSQVGILVDALGISVRLVVVAETADTELLLRSIADNYADETPEDGGQREKSES